MPPKNTFLKRFSNGSNGSVIPSSLKYTKKMMIMRWTQEAGAEIKSVFLCNTKIAAATADDLLALKIAKGFVSKMCVYTDISY